MRIISFLLLILMLLPVASPAGPAVELKPDVGRYDLAPHTEILEDPQGKLTIEDVTSPAYKNQWVLNRQTTPNFAFSNSVYWLRITLDSKLKKPKTWLFEVAFALTDYIDYYLIHDGNIINVIKTGDRTPFSSRQLEHRNFLFQLTIAPEESRQIYLRLKSHDGLHEPCPVILWDQPSFSHANGLRNLGSGLYFGIMLAMVMYNLFIFLSVRDKTYAYYVIYIAGFMFWLAAYSGYSFQYLWPDSTVWSSQVIIVSSSFWAVFTVQFIRSFLDTGRLVPWFDKLAQIVIGCLLFNIILSFAGGYALGITLLISLGIPMSIAALITGAICLRAGFRPARFFMLAWTTLLLSTVVFVLKIAGILPAVFLVEKSIQIGSAIEVVLLSLALADRINELKKDKLLAQEDAIKSFESNLKLKNDFITSISHELRTPMNAVIGGLELAHCRAQEQLKMPLEIIQTGASDMMSLVDDILIHTEIQSGRLRVQSDPVNIRSILRTLRDSYIPMCKEKGLTLDWQIDTTLPETITTDQAKLVTILSKLLDNAVKFTERGTVSLKAAFAPSTPSCWFSCIVTDTGIGIDQEKQQTIFEPFTQSEGGLQRPYGGLGIGLSICRKLVEALNGRLRLTSSVGKGSTFTVTIPIEKKTLPVINQTKNLASADLPILIVEDNPVNQRVMKKLLEKIGYTSVIAGHGQEALEILSKEAVSVILMDLQMPVMDGFDCTATIRNRKDHLKDIPIIAVTANLMDADKKRCIDSGMNDFLKKPVRQEQLLSCLSSYIEAGTP